jgi:sporulation protein YlmC with PRC-barrel domain
MSNYSFTTHIIMSKTFIFNISNLLSITSIFIDKYIYNEQGRVQGHVQKINYKIKTNAILMPIISNELKFNMELNGK